MGTQFVNPNSGPARILGIDPGLNTTGYGVIEVDPAGHSTPGTALGGSLRLREAGIIRSRVSDSIESRLSEIYDGVREVLDAHQPQMLALEQLFSHYERPRTAILMGHARGAICLAAGQVRIPVVHYEPTRVKKLLTGNGRAPKGQMQLAVKLQLGLPTLPEPADVADALAIALCGYHLGNESMIEKLSGQA